MCAKRRVADLLRALPVDIKEHVTPAINRRLHRATRAAVEIAEHMRMFQHFSGRHILLEARL